MRSSLANALTALARCEAALGQRTAALSRVTEARRIRVALSEGNPDFKIADGAVTGLDTLAAQIRAGQVPADDVAFIDPWQN
jgi:hypothetical protein